MSPLPDPLSRLSRPVLATAVAAVGGAAWIGASVGYGSWIEAVYCGVITAGFLGAAWALHRGRDLLVGAGLGLSGVGLALLVLPAVGSPGTWAVPWALYAAGVLWAAAAWHGDRSALVGAGLGIAALGALVLVAMEDVGGATLWTPGNLVLLAGLAWMAWVLPKARTPSSLDGAASA